MINIGPWWLFDIFAFAIIIGSTIYGMTRGFFITFYILILQLIIVLILLFVPALLTNSLNPLFMRLWVLLGLVEAFSALGNMIGESIGSILPGTGEIPISGSGAAYEFLKTISALGLYMFLCLFIFLFVNLIGFFLYKTFKRKMRRIKVIRKVDTLLGAFNGLAIGMILSMTVSFMASFPLFATDHQKIGLVDYSNMTEEQIKNKVLEGNAYKKYSLSRKIASPLPSLPIFGFTYSNACFTKYALDPLMVLGSQMIANKEVKDLKNFFLIYEDVMAEGYSTTNPFSLPISTCIELMPQDTRAVFRLSSELMLMGSTIFVNGLNQQQTSVTSVELINALDKYYKATRDDDITDIHSAWLNEKEMVSFYKWADSNSIENPFVILADNIDASTTTTNKRYLSTVLKDPKLTYNFFKSINYVNATTRNNLDTMPFLSTVYTANYLIKGLEISPSGEMKLGEFDNEGANSISKIEVQKEFWTETYNGVYWIKYYFDFANGYWN
ncbi:CvpA family protein [Spiroplasma diminutum]|uniref:Uncharacterized protein n=1 Tax=Spiroplasma diminutum CUAS-1 TaxID=1276221 RepID=S5MK23_9MOLU|nr:CvpA family protein [Spiroplasma diminutum]AGR42315.1 hypothetical protein SDIMI_v3c06110 [Spiroplasma diminutum CUAS-1]